MNVSFSWNGLPVIRSGSRGVARRARGLGRVRALSLLPASPAYNLRSLRRREHRERPQEEILVRGPYVRLRWHEVQDGHVPAQAPVQVATAAGGRRPEAQ